MIPAVNVLKDLKATSYAIAVVSHCVDMVMIFCCLPTWIMVVV